MEKRTSSGCPLFVFCGVSQWVSGGGKQKIQGGWSCYAARQACETQEKAYCRIWRYKTARYFPPGMPQESLRSGNRHGSMTNCLFSGQGLEVPPRQTATETFHADQRDVFSGVGESLRGGGDSFYKKRPRPLSMMPLQQRRANLRGRLCRLRPWQGCPRSWPARRGCAWRGGPGRSR